MEASYYTIIGALIGAGITAVTAIIIYILKNKTDERRFKTQLTYNRINKAKEKIFTTVNSLNNNIDVHNWSSKITNFLSSYEASVLPQELIEKIQKEVTDLKKNHKENFPDLYAYEEHLIEDAQFDYEQMGPYDRKMYDLQNYMNEMKKRIIQKWLKI